MTSKIGILGCGWLGLPLAVSLIEKGCEVHGSTTSENKLADLREKGITPYLIRLGTDNISGDIDGFLNGLEIIIINVPPGMRRNPDRRYSDEMQLLSHSIKNAGISKVLFVSSTSVYGNAVGEIDEETVPSPVSGSAKQLLASEQLFMSDEKIHSTVVRFGGLIGGDRHPAKQLAGRSGLTNGNDAINLIHLDDCILILSSIIENSWWNQIFNGVFPEHPKKAEYYTAEALKRGLPPPQYEVNSDRDQSKIIHSRNYHLKNGQFCTTIYS